MVEDRALPLGPVTGDPAEQRGKQVYFAHAYGMEPNTGPAGLAPRRAAEKLGRESFAIFSFADRLPCEPGQGGYQKRKIDDIEQVRHVGSPFPRGDR